jgi:hypothetical protein
MPSVVCNQISVYKGYTSVRIKSNVGFHVRVSYMKREKLLGGCIVEEKEEKEEYLRVERNSLNSTDEEEAKRELVVVMLGRCHEEKIEGREEYLKELVVLLTLA